MSAFGDDLVYSSVAEANRQRGSRTISMSPCRCGTNDWSVRNGADSRYDCEYNPGEYVAFTCTNCGFSFEEAS